MKDYYDIYYLSHKFDFEGKVLCEALSKTFINREHNFTIEQFEQIMTFDSDDGMQKKWKAFKKKIDVKMEEFPFILQSINEFLCEPYTAVIKGYRAGAKNFAAAGRGRSYCGRGRAARSARGRDTRCSQQGRPDHERRAHGSGRCQCLYAPWA